MRKKDAPPSLRVERAPKRTRRSNAGRKCKYSQIIETVFEMSFDERAVAPVPPGMGSSRYRVHLRRAFDYALRARDDISVRVEKSEDGREIYITKSAV